MKLYTLLKSHFFYPKYLTKNKLIKYLLLYRNEVVFFYKIHGQFSLVIIRGGYKYQKNLIESN